MGMVEYACNPSIWDGLREEDLKFEFKVNLGYIESSWAKRKKANT